MIQNVLGKSKRILNEVQRDRKKKKKKKKMMCSGVGTSKFPSRQSYDIMKFLGDKDEETGVESAGRRSFNPVKRKQVRGYGNTDQKRLMDSLV